MKTYIRQDLFQQLVSLGLMAVFASTSQAQTQTFKLVANDYAAEDGFGSTVSASGGLGLVTAPGDDDNGGASGSAYLFDVTTGQQLQKLLPDDGGELDGFGSGAAMDGNLAVITSAFLIGGAYVFDVTTGQQLGRLVPTDGTANFKFADNSVALSGNVAIIGAPTDGSAYVFDITTGTQTFKLHPADGFASDRFGQSVAISGHRVIVGAEGKDMGAGAAYIFDATTGQQLFKLVANDRAPARLFGGAVAISDTTAVIGSTLDDQHGSRSGAAYVFDVTTGQQLFKLTAADASPVDFFGWAVALSGNFALIGAPIKAGETGAAYLFDVTTGQQLARVLAGDGASGDSFGGSVALSGNTVLIGAGGDTLGTDPNPSFTAGSAYVYRINQSPIADASATKLFWTSPNDTAARVVLDGSRSFDPDDDPLSYQWFLGGTPIQTGIIAVVSLPVGMHDLDLLVDDGMAQDIDSLRIHVLTAAQSVERLTSLVENSGLQKQQQLLASLQAALASIRRGDHIPAVNQLHAFLHKLQAQVAPNNPALAAELSRLTTEIISALAGNGSRGRAARIHRVNHALRGQVR